MQPDGSASIIIPTRYGSSRLNGKPLLRFSGQTLIEHTWRAASRTGLPVWVATDDDRIHDACVAFGANVVMTSPEHRNGTERCAEAADRLDHDGPVINWQGDSPLVPALWIRALVDEIESGGCDVATPIQHCTVKQADLLRHGYLSGHPGGTSAVVNSSFEALYFSKAPIPHGGTPWLHVGIYAYTREALRLYGKREGQLEAAEGLEQLRFLESGMTIRCVPVTGPEIWEVNTFPDIRVVERLMEERSGASRT